MLLEFSSTDRGSFGRFLATIPSDRSVSGHTARGFSLRAAATQAITAIPSAPLEPIKNLQPSNPSMIMATLSIEPATTPEQLQALQTLAQGVWLAHYLDIITHTQTRRIKRINHIFGKTVKWHKCRWSMTVMALIYWHTGKRVDHLGNF